MFVLVFRLLLFPVGRRPPSRSIRSCCVGGMASSGGAGLSFRPFLGGSPGPGNPGFFTKARQKGAYYGFPCVNMCNELPEIQGRVGGVAGRCTPGGRCAPRGSRRRPPDFPSRGPVPCLNKAREEGPRTADSSPGGGVRYTPWSAGTRAGAGVYRNSGVFPGVGPSISPLAACVEVCRNFQHRALRTPRGG